jgi:hypothetical protein
MLIRGGKFESGRWDTKTSPDLRFESKDQDGLPLSVNRVIKNKFPKSQHCPITVSVGIIIPTIDKPPMPRWNLRKADWVAFSKYVEENINRIKPKTANYIRFVKLLKTAAKKSIPKGHRHSYTPCWSK